MASASDVTVLYDVTVHLWLTFLSGRPWRGSRIQAGRFCPWLSSLVQSLFHLFKDNNHKKQPFLRLHLLVTFSNISLHYINISITQYFKTLPTTIPFSTNTVNLLSVSFYINKTLLDLANATETSFYLCLFGDIFYPFIAPQLSHPVKIPQKPTSSKLCLFVDFFDSFYSTTTLPSHADTTETLFYLCFLGEIFHSFHSTTTSQVSAKSHYCNEYNKRGEEVGNGKDETAQQQQQQQQQQISIKCESSRSIPTKMCTWRSR